ncbi:TPA: nucleoside phosphorylase [Streptococcus suis]|uniref:Uridine phosphorylase n=4 Tax=Streptococcus suis TaxID=1307 RepID=A0A0H3MZZ0_STRS4|nr:nucleoside phosphorylase [Streptococcus suis]ABP91895.1 uridine phosphorylase [Streptococcus suis 98HAH33]ADE31184.1 uridine phosphorylase [Streptococcus suis GZ1]ADV69910.1 uridine phosphorylase [Streptococcus suis JS14]AER14876.1 uridine phosphorylase [Streptococcus suis SS12]AER44015.1 uridine phosphorylase [Streptococcus suis A7]
MVLQPHIRCDIEQGARYAILPGDPQRVDRVAEFLDSVEFIAFNREHKTMRGSYKGVPVLVTSTGMGGASTGIAVEELARIGVECMIRIGSCGALQPEMQMGDLVILNGAVRDEGTSRAYVDPIFPAVPDPDVLFALRGTAMNQGFAHHVGIARSHDSFYIDNELEVDHFWSKKGVLAGDMESAALFTIGSLRGIKTGSILNTVALYDGELKDEINQYVSGENRVTQGEKNEILTTLEAIVMLEEQRKG